MQPVRVPNQPNHARQMLRGAGVLPLLFLALAAPASAEQGTATYPVTVASGRGTVQISSTACGDGSFQGMRAVATLREGVLERLEVHEETPFPWFLDDGIDVSVSGAGGVFALTGTHVYRNPTGGTATLPCVGVGAVELVAATVDCAALTMQVAFTGKMALAGNAGPQAEAVRITSTMSIAPCLSGASYALQTAPGGTPLLGVACVRDAWLSLDLNDDGEVESREPYKTVTLGSC
ncbi:MAG TPA: hypothetical protein VHI93_06025 [Candidatus Thermoplasmatota archaeon]|nr:hypothetical protein [Candidatus Thermoplasmatota archaeon]